MTHVVKIEVSQTNERKYDTSGSSGLFSAPWYLLFTDFQPSHFQLCILTQAFVLRPSSFFWCVMRRWSKCVEFLWSGDEVTVSQCLFWFAAAVWLSMLTAQTSRIDIITLFYKKKNNIQCEMDGCPTWYVHDGFSGRGLLLVGVHSRHLVCGQQRALQSRKIEKFQSVQKFPALVSMWCSPRNQSYNCDYGSLNPRWPPERSVTQNPCGVEDSKPQDLNRRF